MFNIVVTELESHAVKYASPSWNANQWQKDIEFCNNLHFPSL